MVFECARPCRLPWCTPVTIPLQCLVNGASYTLDDEAVRMVPDWLLFHPRLAEASHDLVATVHEVGSTGAVVLLRSIQMMVTVAKDLDTHVRIAYDRLHPVLVASAPCLLQKSATVSDDRHRKMRDHFLRWVQEKCTDAVLKHLLRQDHHNTQAKLFAMSVADRAPAETSRYLFSAIAGTDPFIAASVFVTATGACNCTGAITLLGIFMTTFETGYGCTEHMYPTMRACVPFLTAKVVGPQTQSPDASTMAEQTVGDLFRKICERSELDQEVHGIWRKVGSAVVSEDTAYHPAMCG